MDFNIAAAFWFASAGTGWIYQPPSQPTRLNVKGNDDADNSPCRSPHAVAACTDSKVDASSGVSARATASGIPLVINKDAVIAETFNNSDGIPLASGGCHLGGSTGDGGKAIKINKNMEELCPVEGCRRLLKPGCVFGTCSRCCLKAQGLVDAACFSRPSTSLETVTVAAVTPSEEIKSQDLFKARAAAEALKALEDHLAEQFDQLPRPFRAEALAALLRQNESSRVRTGRDQHRHYSASTSSARQTATKWCPVHKRSSKGKRDGGKPKGEAGVERAEDQLMPRAMFTSTARVLLVSAWHLK